MLDGTQTVKGGRERDGGGEVREGRREGEECTSSSAGEIRASTMALVVNTLQSYLLKA